MKVRCENTVLYISICCIWGCDDPFQHFMPKHQYFLMAVAAFGRNICVYNMFSREK